MSTTAHVFAALIACGSIAFILRFVRRGALRAKYALLWLSIGVVIAILAVSPGLLDRVSAWVGVAYPPTTLFLVAIALLLLVAVHFSWELSRLEDRVRILAEELALHRAESADGPSRGGRGGGASGGGGRDDSGQVPA